MSIQLSDGFQGQTLDRVLEDILVRFVINAPPEDLSSNARVFFLFEEAHWFYLDFVRTLNPSLPGLKMKAFSKKLIELFPMIWEGGDPEEGLKEFVSYKQSIPVRGAALFTANLNKILLIQGTESVNWSFPRGKISKDEDDAACAIREVKEEIGFDISPYLKEDEYIERTIRGKNYRIYLCKNIPEDAEFKPQVRNEINAIEWRDFRNLCKKMKNNSGKYFLVNSMIQPLIQYVKKNKGEVSEEQLKLQIEAQLKSMLGVGEEVQPANDPGRELLDFIRTSAANKQLKDQQAQPNGNHATPPSQAQSQQPSHQQPQPFPQHFPMQFPMPGYGFQPPVFQHAPFMPSSFAPFAPFAPPQQGGIPQLHYQPYSMPMPFNLPPIPQGPTQFQSAPNPEQLKRPSVGLRNEEGSRELLGLLKNKKEDEKEKNARELLSSLMKKDGNEKPKVQLLKRENNNEQNSNEHKNALLALLNKKPEVKEQTSKDNDNKSNTDASKALLDMIKPKKDAPKLTILKRDSLQSQNKPQQSFTEAKQSEEIVDDSEESEEDPEDEFESKTTHTDRFDSPAPPTKELLELIKKSKAQAEDGELFEDFTDEDEIESYESVADDNETKEDINPEDFEIDDEYKDDIASINKPIVDFEQPSYANIPSKREPLNVRSSQSSAPVQTTPKKFTLLKRGENLDDVAKTQNGNNTDDAKKESDDVEDQSGTSTIEFSDDAEDEEENEESLAEDNAEDLNMETANQSLEHLPSENGQAKNDLLNLLHRPSPASTSAENKSYKTLDDIEAEDADTDYEYSSTNSNPLLDLLRSNTPKEEPQTRSNGGNELLNMLHKTSAPSQQEQSQSNAGHDILSLLHKKPEHSLHSVQSQPQPQTTNAGQDLLSLLHKNSNSTDREVTPSPSFQASTESPSPSQDLLSLLQRKSPAPATPLQASDLEGENIEPSAQNHGSSANDLLNLLHKSPSPQPETPIASPQPEPQAAAQAPSNSLLSLLFKR